MADNFEDPSKKRRLDEEGTSSAFADAPVDTRKVKLESWLKPLNNEQLFKLLLDMYVTLCSQDRHIVLEWSTVWFTGPSVGSSPHNTCRCKSVPSF